MSVNPMLDFFLANRNLAQNYLQDLANALDASIRPEEFTPADGIDPQAFYLEFKKRAAALANRETEQLKNETAHGGNCHLILLKYTALVDAVIKASFKAALWFYNRNHQTDLRDNDVPIAIVACGGYGREEMYFRSDVDIRVVSKSGEPRDDSLAKILEYFEYLFVHQDIFLAASSVAHTSVPGGEIEFDPQTPDTLISQMEHRFVAGNIWVYNEFKSLVKTASLLNQEKILDYCKTHKNYYDVQNTVFNQEPNVKTEMRRLYWALFLARVRYKLEKTNSFELIQELYNNGHLSGITFKNMQNCLNFLSKVRLLLHCKQKGTHRDVLSFEVREQVAESMGYGLKQFYREYYYEAAYPLKKYSRNLFLELTSFDPQKVKDLNLFLAVNAGRQIIFLPGGETYLEEHPEAIFQIPVWVARENYFLSLPVIRVIERSVNRVGPIFLTEGKKKEIRTQFKTIVKGKYFAKGIRLLHEFGLLQQYFIPEFKNLCGLLQDIYVHKFPTDIHVLFALDVLNELEQGVDADPFLVELYRSLKDKTALKLAVLLHDIGKGAKAPGQNEEMVGAEMTPGILENLGYRHKQKRRIRDVAFLVEKHLTMMDLMFLDPEEDETYEMIWDLVDNDQERLKMLILLTYADRGGTKMNMSAGQIEQLRNFYQYTLQHKKRQSVPNAVKMEFMEMIRLPRGLQSQLEIYDEFLHSREKFAVEMFFKPGQACDLIICLPDMRGVLFKVATALFFNQVNIVEAKIHTREHNVFDVFKVYDASGAPIEFSNYYFLQKKIKEELRKIFVDHEPVSSIYKGGSLAAKGKAARHESSKLKIKIKIIGRAVSIETYDALGTFMMETKVFADLNMEVQRAVLHTHQETASNIFYLRPRDVRQIIVGEENFKNKLREALGLLENPQSILWEEPVEMV